MKLKLTVAALMVLLSGCGTVANLSKQGPPYGGVGEDVTAGEESYRYWCHPSGACIPPIFDLTRAGCLLGIDLPLSVVGDTLTLPVTLVQLSMPKKEAPITATIALPAGEAPK
jgi:uncharacterized protein YceK